MVIDITFCSIFNERRYQKKIYKYYLLIDSIISNLQCLRMLDVQENPTEVSSQLLCKMVLFWPLDSGASSSMTTWLTLYKTLNSLLRFRWLMKISLLRLRWLRKISLFRFRWFRKISLRWLMKINLFRLKQLMQIRLQI